MTLTAVRRAGRALSLELGLSATSAPSIARQTGRIVSVDALRGFAMFWIIGGDGAMVSLDQILRERGSVLSAAGGFLGRQFTHNEWEGVHFYDIIFPLFIFITGISALLSLPGLAAREGKAKTYVHIVRRSVLLFVLGVVVNGGVSHHWPDVRLLGVLQRIAICYFFTSFLVLNLELRGLVASLIAVLAGYWALMTWIPVPDIGAGSFGPDANLANWLDANYLPGRLFDETRDPEGILSTLPAIGTCLLGALAGMLLRDVSIPARQKTVWLCGAGIALVAAGHIWAVQFPIIKAIWTSSFVLVAGGYSAILLGMTHLIIDIWEYKRWSAAFVWIGANPTILYCVSMVLGFETFALRFAGGDVSDFFDSALLPGTGRFAAHVIGLVFAIILARYLYRRKIFLRV